MLFYFVEKGMRKMEIKELSKNQRIEVYERHLKNDFHESEVKPTEMIESLIKKGNYKCCGFYEEEEFLGYAFFANTEKSLLLDYLVVDSKYRSKGYGSKFLSIIRKEFSSKYLTLLAEVENPRYAADEDDKANRERRISFYLKNNFRISDVETSVLEDQYMIIELKLDKNSEDIEALDSMNKIYETIFGDIFFRKNIKVNKINS